MKKQPSFTLEQLTQHLNAKLIGDPSTTITSIANLAQADNTQISFLSSKNYLKHLCKTQAAAVILTKEHQNHFAGNRLIVDDPYQSYAQMSQLFDTRTKRASGIHPSAIIAESAQIANTASIGANCTIGENVVIGKHTEIYPNVTIEENTIIGNHCLIYANVSIYADVNIGHHVLIHSATVIGCDGFGFAPSPQGWKKIHQLGSVVIGDHVDIGASVTIDRGALDDTMIEDHVIIDNQVHIAHNVKIGRNTAIAGCVGIAGSTTIGQNCTIGGDSGISGHITIADNCHFHGGSIVTKSIKEAGNYASITPLMDVKQWRKSAVRYSQLDEWVKRIKALEKKEDYE